MGKLTSPGDLVHADRYGAVVIPTDVFNLLSAAIKKMQETEQLILGPARGKGFDFSAFEEASAAFEKSRV
jgi:regulator of RNase E activity RraA